MNETEQMKVLADQLFLYLKTKFKDLTRDNVKYFRAEVASNPGGGKLEISRPLDQTTMVLPCMPALYSAVAGDQVTVFVFGNLSNAVVVSNGTFSADVDMSAIAQMIADAVSGKADQSAIAPEYDNTATYAVGDYCTYNGLLYKCTTAITTAEEWTVAHWTETTVEEAFGGSDVFVARYGETTYAAIKAAYDAGKFIYVTRAINGTTIYLLSDFTGTAFYFRSFSNSSTTNYGCYISDANVWAVNSYTYATTNSPTFTGTPKAPTAAAGTNTTQIATTAFVQAAIAAALGNS